MKKSTLISMFALLSLIALTVFIGQMPEKAIGSSAKVADNDLCAECHEELVATIHENTHGRIKAFEVSGEAGCVSCHEGAMKHAEEGGDPEFITSYSDMNASDSTDQCLTCHAGANMAHWQGSAHEMSDLSCTSCHNIHTNAGYSDHPATERCYKCHDDVEAEMMLPSHHPVTEGHMSCYSCHDPHGTAADTMLKSSERLNDLCLKCHTAMQGPFIFEHPPVVEDCAICHTPHGSVADNLLSENEPYLCLQCHELHFHTGAVGMHDEVVVQRGEPLPNPHTSFGWKMAFATKCTQCHTTHHGTDLPSQGITSQGNSFTR